MLFLGSPDSQTKVFPQDRVLLVGSDITVCCVTQEEVLSAQIGSTYCPLIHLDGRNVAIKIRNISASESSGTNVVFSVEDNMFGTVIFAGCKYIIFFFFKKRVPINLFWSSLKALMLFPGDDFVSFLFFYSLIQMTYEGTSIFACFKVSSKLVFYIPVSI